MSGDREERKRERSMPFTTRVDLITVAKLDKYWSESGEVMRSVSQLIGWSMDLLLEIVERNKQGKGEGMGKLNELQTAYDYLCSRGLMQRSNKERGRKKYEYAVRARNLRFEGDIPAVVMRRQYNTVHNSQSVRVRNSEVNEDSDVGQFCGTTDEEWGLIQRKIAEDKAKEIEEEKRKNIETIKNAGSLGKDKDEENSNAEDSADREKNR